MKVGIIQKLKVVGQVGTRKDSLKIFWIFFQNQVKFRWKTFAYRVVRSFLYTVNFRTRQIFVKFSSLSNFEPRVGRKSKIGLLD